jgi:hypothetical protein
MAYPSEVWCEFQAGARDEVAAGSHGYGVIHFERNAA